MRRTIISGLLLACFVSITPVAAQGTPPPEEIAAAVERVGGTSNALQLLFMVLLLVVAWRGLKPLIDSNTEANKRAGTAQEALLRRIEREDAVEQTREQVRQSTASSLERTASILSDIETKTQATEGRASAVKTINDHTDTAHEETRRLITAFEGRLDTALARLNDAYASIDARLGSVDDTIRVNLNEVRSELTTIKQAVDTVKGDTGPLDERKLPQEPPAPKEPDPWTTDDNPPNLPPETK